MLLTLRFPVVDLRPFSQIGYPGGVRLPATWSEDAEFVRNFGAVRRRLRGPVEPWLSERSYCRYDRALRFPACYQSLLLGAVPGLKFFGVERRLYPANIRNDLYHFDLQIAGRSRYFTTPCGVPGRHYAPADFDLVSAVTAVLAVRATVRWPGGRSTTQAVGLVGKPLAAALDAATTADGPSGDLFPGAVAVVIETDERDSVSARWLSEWTVDDGLILRAKPVTFAGRSVNAFVISRPAGVHRDRARALRVHLLRLHADREYLRRMTRLLAQPGFLDNRDRDQIDRVQNALNGCLAALNKASAGLATAEITTAFMADRILASSDLDLLEERVRRFRPVIARRLRHMRDLEDAAEERWRDLVTRNPDLKSVTYINEVNMSHYDQRNSQIGAAGDHASATNVSFGDQLNLAVMSPADIDALQAALRTLRKHLAGQLIADSAIQVDSEEISPTQVGSAIGALSEAEEAVAAKDEQRAQGALRRCGHWLVSFAQQVGVVVAAAAIQTALHLP